MDLLTNGHAMLGYKDAAAYVPVMPLRTCAGGLKVIDAHGHWLASFRNREDSDAYISERTATMEAGRAAYEMRCAEAARNEPPEGKSVCPCCRKFFGNVRQHIKDSTKCSAIKEST